MAPGKGSVSTRSGEAIRTELERAGTRHEAISEEPLPSPTPGRARSIPDELGRVVLVLQGGGALGAYQAGVYAALHDAGIEPDWVIGTSIGAINASLMAGNAVADRLSRLRKFWSRVQQGPFHQAIAPLPVFGGLAVNWLPMVGGIPGFFKPN